MAIERLFDREKTESDAESLYEAPRFPEPPPHRPYIVVNMVSTVDGKILIGPRGSTARGVGGPTDQRLMKRLEKAVDGIIIGAGTLRPGSVIYPPEKWRAVVTRSGELPLQNRFFTDAPDRAIVFAPRSLPEERRAALSQIASLHLAGGDSVDAAEAVTILRRQYDIRSLLLEGGADLNFTFFQAGLVDQLFLTLAPKVKGGAHLPTPVDGPGFPGREHAVLELLSVYRDASELYLRYAVLRS